MHARLPVPFATTLILSVTFFHANVLRGLAAAPLTIPARGQRAAARKSPRHRRWFCSFVGRVSVSAPAVKLKGGCASLTRPTCEINRPVPPLIHKKGGYAFAYPPFHRPYQAPLTTSVDYSPDAFRGARRARGLALAGRLPSPAGRRERSPDGRLPSPAGRRERSPDGRLPSPS